MNYLYEPTVTVYFPTYNEEALIAKKLGDILGQNYPHNKLEILIIDVRSIDRTVAKIKEYQQNYQNIRLIQLSKRVGFPETLNIALREASGEILIKTDCDSITKSKDTLKKILSNFEDPNIGGVTGICGYSKGLEKYYYKIIGLLQVAESNLDSTIVAHSASFVAFRRKISEPIEEDLITDDASEFILIRKKGYRTIVDLDVVLEEEVPDKISERRVWKSNRAWALIKTLLRHKEVIFNPEYGIYGLLIYPMNIFLLTISPFIIPLIVFISLIVLYIAWPGYVAIALLLFGLTIFWKKDFFIAFLDIQVNIIGGLLKILTERKKSEWEKVR